jgi:hypothetical protein
MATIHRHGGTILHKDAAGQTVQDYVIDRDIWNIVQQGVAHERAQAEIHRKDVAFSAIVAEFAATASKGSPAKSPDDKIAHLVPPDELRKMRHGLEVPPSAPPPKPPSTGNQR